MGHEGDVHPGTCRANGERHSAGVGVQSGDRHRRRCVRDARRRRRHLGQNGLGASRLARDALRERGSAPRESEGAPTRSRAFATRGPPAAGPGAGQRGEWGGEERRACGGKIPRTAAATSNPTMEDAPKRLSGRAGDGAPDRLAGRGGPGTSGKGRGAGAEVDPGAPIAGPYRSTEDAASGAGSQAGASTTGWRWPVNGVISKSFSRSSVPGKEHHGLDIAAAHGTPVHAARSGQVTFAGKDSVFGQMVLIDHGGNLQSLYGHNSTLRVGIGDRVVAGQEIARVGSTGESSAPHLHFEIRSGGQAIDPRRHLP